MRDRFQKFMHFLAGTISVLHGIVKLESDQSTFWFYLLCGIFMLTLAFFHEELEKKKQKLAGSLYWMEAIVICFISLEYFSAHKSILPWFYLLVGLSYFYVGYRMMYLKINKKQKL